MPDPLSLATTDDLVLELDRRFDAFLLVMYHGMDKNREKRDCRFNNAIVGMGLAEFARVKCWDAIDQSTQEDE